MGAYRQSRRNRKENLTLKIRLFFTNGFFVKSKNLLTHENSCGKMWLQRRLNSFRIHEAYINKNVCLGCHPRDTKTMYAMSMNLCCNTETEAAFFVRGFGRALFIYEDD